MYCGTYTNGMNGPGLRCEMGELREPSRIQGSIRYVKELGFLPKDNGNQGPNVSREMHEDISVLIQQ